MRVFGLTGGIGMGKSTSAHLIRSRSIPVVDTDDLARQVVEPGQPALAQVQSAFGQSIIAPDGTLRRDELARLVFADPSARRTSRTSCTRLSASFGAPKSKLGAPTAARLPS